MAERNGKSKSELTLRVGGMTCVGCQNRIERALTRTPGVTWARVSYADARARIEYDPSALLPSDVEAVIENTGYRVIRAKRSGPSPRAGAGGGSPAGAGAAVAGGPDLRMAIGILVLVVAAFLLLHNAGVNLSLGNIPLAREGMSYGLLFVIGLMTSVHCVAMCGGINISQCIPAGAVASGAARGIRTSRHSGQAPKARDSESPRAGATCAPSLKYNLARVASYTAVGAAVGGIGSVFSLSGDLKGLIQLIAGVFMVIMGLSMFGIIPGIGRLVPRLPRVFGEKIEEAGSGAGAGTGRTGGRGPVVVGLLNGLMPCGPLQAMQLFALSTGSPAQGALSMLFFSLGTVPLMFGLGALSSALGGRFTARAMTVGAALVILLGLFMFAQGLALSGVALPQGAAQAGASGVAQETADTGSAAADSGGAADGAGGAATEDSAQADSGGAAGAAGSGGAADAPAADVGPLDGYVDTGGNEYSVDGDTLVVRSTLGPGTYPYITVMKGVPVRWIIDAPEGSLNGCNEAIYIPEYDIEYAFSEGENIIEFTPDESGSFGYTCWMGMIPGNITVIE
jgi:sulfite exporter TauE/SafE/copper chaperone CopZ